MARRPAPAYLLRVRVDSEPVWARLEEAPLSIRMALEEVGGRAAGRESLAGWIRDRMRVLVDVGSMGIEAQEAVRGVVEASFEEVSIDGAVPQDAGTFGGTALRVLHVTSGVGDGDAARVPEVWMAWASASQGTTTPWRVARASVELDRAPQHDASAEAGELSPVEWFEGVDPGRAGRRRGRKVRIGIRVDGARLKGALSRDELPRELREGCPWCEGEARAVEPADARRWLSKHLCFEVEATGGNPLLSRVEAGLEELSGSRIVSVTEVELVDGWPVVDAETTVAVEVDGELDDSALASIARAVRLSWRDGTGTVGEQERHELAGPRIAVTVTRAVARAPRPGRRGGSGS